jgi:branched-chain amino acid aminotransferase
VINGTSLFLKDHLKRLEVSAAIAQKEIKYSESEIRQFLIQLIDANKTAEGNIIITCLEKMKIFFIAHSYPENELYTNGIHCGILHAEREKPNAKVFQTGVRQQADELIKRNDFYEVLLIDHFNRITEGSRSNIFFISENKIITPPGNEVLLGITRRKAISLAKKNGYEVIEADLPTFQAALITVTSPMFLPVNKINEIKFDPQNKIVQQLISDYETLIQKYIKSQLSEQKY